MSLPIDLELPEDLKEIESLLAGLNPRPVPESLVGETLAQMEEGSLGTLEGHLQGIAPATLSEDVLGRMASAMDRWHEHVPEEEKVVSFDKGKARHPKRKSGGMLAAAAAVAMLGAISALVLPQYSGHQDQGTVQSFTTSPPIVSSENVQPASAQSLRVIPGSLSQKIVNARHEGIVMSRDQRPLRCIRVEYMEKVKVRDENGNIKEVERPRVDRMLIPLETN